MRLRGSVLGALNMFHVDTGLMRPADMAAAQALADVATIAILQHRAALEAKLLNEQLNEALNTRIMIEQAKGMIAERRGVGMEAAFTALRDHARTHNLRLADVAGDLVEGRQDLATLGHP
jgi:AmiR/NasT family two-component response regulator